MNWYGPIQRGVSGISGVLERGAERESQHLTRMGELGLAGRRLGMEQKRLGMAEETHGLDVRAKELAVGEAERLKLKRDAERARMQEPSPTLGDINKLSEVFGPPPEGQGNEYWIPFAEKAIPGEKHIREDPADPASRLVGFKATKGEVGGIANRVLGLTARGDPTSLPDRLRSYRGLQDKLATEFGATKDGNRKVDAQWKAAGREADRIEVLIKALVEGPAAGLTAISMLYGEGALKDKDRQLVDAYKKAIVAKKAGTLKLSPKQEIRQEGLKRYYETYSAGMGMLTPDAPPIEPFIADYERQVMGGVTQGGLKVTGGPQVKPRRPGETLAEYLKRTKPKKHRVP